EHKGIDDALVAGAAVEVLGVDASRKAIAETLAEATAGEPATELDPVDRLAGVLEGGAEALFRDGNLLRALARKAENDPAEFGCLRARIDRAGVRLRDLDKALAPHREELRRQRPPRDTAGTYGIVGGRIVHQRTTREGPVEVPLANWSGS